MKKLSTISFKPNPEHYVGFTRTQEGGGGTPVHLMRRLTLEDCATAKEKYKHWHIGN